MKNLSIKFVIFFFFLIVAGLYSAALWANIAGGIGAIVMIVLLHLENLDFCKKLDRVMAGEKNVKF